MTEEEAAALVCSDVSRETARRLQRYVDRLKGEAGVQNLISAATIDQIWQRHILDSSQLLTHASGEDGLWLDIGSGAGLPGIVIAILRSDPIVLLEPRAKRAAFLRQLVEDLGLGGDAQVIDKTAVSAPPLKAAIISARAVASLDALFSMASRFAAPETLWVLPKGRSAADELAAAQRSWQGEFRLAPSQTDSSASIVLARGVRPKR